MAGRLGDLEMTTHRVELGAGANSLWPSASLWMIGSGVYLRRLMMWPTLTEFWSNGLAHHRADDGAFCGPASGLGQDFERTLAQPSMI